MKVEIVNENCMSEKDCKMKKDIVLDENLNVVAIIPATKHKENKNIKYWISIDWYVVVAYALSKYEIRIKPKYPIAIDPETMDHIKDIILANYKYITEN